jgi:hypothetical protein
MSVVQIYCLACGTPVMSANNNPVRDGGLPRPTSLHAMAFCTNCQAIYSVELLELRAPRADAARNVNT